jgi:hypothetical protein
MTDGKAAGQVGVRTALEGGGQESPQLPAGQALEKGSGWRNTLIRVITFIVGVAAVTSAFVLWLVPTSHTSTTAAENTTTTVTDSAGHKSTTAVKKLTATTMPGTARSDAMLVAVLTFGAGLLFVASLWNQIQEFAFGGVSIKLSERAVAAPEIALVDAVAVGTAYVGSTSFDNIAKEADRISKAELGLVRIDLRQGDLWVTTNLCLFVLLLAGHSRAEVVVFSGQDFAGQDVYLGAASIGLLANRLAAGDPVLAAAYLAVETMPPENPLASVSFGGKLDAELGNRNRVLDPSDKVDTRRLYTLAGKTMITASVEGSGNQKLSKQQQRQILNFPLSYVPITYHSHLDNVIDKGQLTKKIALSAVGISG